MKLRGKTLTWRATPRTLRLAALPVLPLALLAGCGGSSDPGLPQLTAASPAMLPTSRSRPTGVPTSLKTYLFAKPTSPCPLKANS